MSSKFSYTEQDRDIIKNAITIREAINRYNTKGIAVSDTRNNIKCPSVTHNDQNPSAKIYDDTNTCYCFGCKKSWDVIGYTREVFNCDYKEALERLIDDFNLPIEKPQNRNPNQEQKPYFNDVFPVDMTSLRLLNFIHEENFDFTRYYAEKKAHINETNYHRGLSPQTLDHFNIGFDPKWQNPDPDKKQENTLYPRIIIPTSKSSFLARLAVSLNDKRIEKILKCRKVGDLHLFNAKVLDLQDTSPIFICEGEIDAMSFYEVGANAIGLGGTSGARLFVEELDKRQKITHPFILALDNDKNTNAGQKCSSELSNLLSERGLFYMSMSTNDLYLGCKDANEALTTDRDRFKRNVQSLTNCATRIYYKSDRTISPNIKENLINLENAIKEINVPESADSLKAAWENGNANQRKDIETYLIDKADHILISYRNFITSCQETCDFIKRRYDNEFWDKAEPYANELIRLSKESREEANATFAELPNEIKPIIRDIITFHKNLDFVATEELKANRISEVRDKISNHQQKRIEYYKKMNRYEQKMRSNLRYTPTHP